MKTKMNGLKVLVTGGAGFIGSHLVDALIEQGATVTVVDDLSNGRIENINKKARFVCASIRDAKIMSECLQNSEFVFHLAADTATKETSMGWASPYDEMRVNIEGSINILKCILDRNLSTKVVFTSSAAVYGEPKYTPIDEQHPLEPISPYGISKLAAEKYILACFKEFGIKSVIARLFNTYGPRQSRYVMHDLIRKLESNQDKLEVLGNGTTIRDYAYVSDTVAALLLVADRGNWGEIYNVAGGEPVSIKHLTAIILETLCLARKTEIAFTGSSWKGDITKMMANVGKIRKLGFNPKVNLEKGIDITVRWFVECQKASLT
jgi:UDP-glucose 4-epimerase